MVDSTVKPKDPKTKKTKREPLPVQISSADAAKLIGMSQGRLETLVFDGRITKAAHGCFDPVQLVHEFVAYKGGIGARSEVEKQKAIKLQRENAAAAKKTLPTEYHFAAIDKICIALKSWLSALPGRIASVGANSEAAVLRDLVRAECARTIEDFEAAAAGDFESLRDEAPEDDGADSYAGRLGGAEQEASSE